MSKPEKTKDYEVGKGRPPKHSRFKPGQSGNPRGRGKGVKNLKTVLHDALAKNLIVTEGGRRKRINKFELIMSQLTNDAARGKPQALKMLLDLVRAYPLVAKPSSPKLITEDMTPKEAMEAYQALLREEEEED